MSYVILSSFRAPVRPRDVPSEIIDKWATTLKLRRDLIYARLITKVPDEASFLTKIAEPSSEVWETFINPTFPDAYLITLKQKIKLAISYPRWQAGIGDAFREGGRFEQGIDLKKDRLDLLKFPLGATGIRYLGWGAGYKAVGFITGDHRVRFITVEGEEVFGEPVNCFPEEYVEFVRPALMAMLTQGATLSLYAESEGLEALRTEVINAINSKISAYMTPLLKPEYSASSLRLEYDPDIGEIVVVAEVASTA